MWLRIVLLGLLLVSAPVPLFGQIVHGRVVDDRTGTPVPGARVTVLEGDAPAAPALLTSAEGRFQLLLPRGGTYRLRVEQLGYPVYSSEEFRAVAFERIEVEVRLTPQPIELAPLEVVARGNEPGREGFARRRALGRGVFFDPIHVALTRNERHIGVVTDFLRHMRGPNFGEADRVRGWGCTVSFLDYGPFPIGYRGPQPGPRVALGGYYGVDQFVDPRTVRGVEWYRSIDEVPAELREGRNWAAIDRCAVIWYWTEMGW